MRILLLHDDAGELLSLERALLKEGHEVMWVSELDSALPLVRWPDAVVVGSRNHAGISALIARLRAALRPDIPVIVAHEGFGELLSSSDEPAQGPANRHRTS
jgi:DNA-binding response OmpR family regulator